MLSFNERYKSFEDGSVELRIEKSNKNNIDTEIVMDVNIKNYPLKDYKSMNMEFNDILKNYSKVNGRNSKKDDLHLNKHAMHLVRLYLMCFDVLEKQEIRVHREKDLELLLSIRDGKYQKEDGKYSNDFFELVKGYEKRLEYAKNNTTLPKNPNYKLVEEMVMGMNKRIINR
jgi:uncharacterized protein